jgi:prepilin-type N-terminal cleavage/methylation domain-containing protein
MPSNVRPPRIPRKAFSLIELLIVVTIISILASIAVPNFLEAQTRSKVSRVKADMRTLMTAVQSYYVDNNAYPVRRNTTATDKVKPATAETARRLEQMAALTTPIAYVTYLPADIFEQTIRPPNNVIDYYDRHQVLWLTNSLRLSGQVKMVELSEVSWMLISVGPDGFLGPLSDSFIDVNTPFVLKGTIFLPYDPTNGSVSTGNIYGSDDGGLDYAGQRFSERATRR